MLSIYDGAVSEAQWLHGREDGNASPTSDALFFSTFRKTTGRPIQRSYRMPSLETVVASMVGTEDTYISQSAFWSFSRKTVHFKQTRAAWVDLDLYNIDKKVDAATVSQILRHAEHLGIPAPTAVIASGRGCYLKWMFLVPVTQHQLPVWQTLQALLTSAFSSLAADFKSRDASRVLRVLQTRNSKSGGLVEVIDGCGELYDFHTMCRTIESLQLELLVEAQASSSINMARKVAKRSTALSDSLLYASSRGDIEALNLFTELHRPIMLEKLSARSLNWGRFCDLRNLYEQRGGVPVGERDQAMFWMLNFLSHSNVIHASNWDREIADLQQAFPEPASFEPLKDGSMSTLLKRVRHNESGIKYRWKGAFVSALYRPSNQFLIDAFAIAPQEMKPLSTIISADEKRARVDVKTAGRSDRRDDRNKWRDEVRQAFIGQQASQLDMHVAGMGASTQSAAKNDSHVNLSALAIYLGVERTRVTRYWSRLKQESLAQLDSQPLSQQDLDSASASQRAAFAVNCFESVRLKKLATLKAIEAKQAQSRLTFERQQLVMQDTWARRKLNGITKLLSSDDQDTDMQADKSKSSTLSKKKALLQVALSTNLESHTESEPVPERVASTATDAGDQQHQVHQALPVSDAADEQSDNDEGYGELFSATQDFQSMVNDSPSADYGSDFAADEPELTLPAPAPELERSPLMVSEVAIQAPAKLSAAERLQAFVRAPAQSYRTQKPEATSFKTPAAISKPAVAASVAPDLAPITALAPSVAGVVPPSAIKPLSPTERLRLVTQRVALLPPLQRESKASSERVPLVLGAVGAPKAYPNEAQWPSQIIPPGSHYSEEEWQVARVDVSGQTFEVIEIQSAQKSFLMQLAIPERVTTQQIKGNVLVAKTQEVCDLLVDQPGINSLLRQIYSDCLLVSNDSFPSFPGATEADFILNSARFRVIRPRQDYLDAARSYRVGAVIKMAVDSPVNLPVEALKLPQKKTSHDDHVAEDSETEPPFSESHSF